MADCNDTGFAKMNDDNKTENEAIEQQLIDAQKEIEDLKMQIMWLERSYE
ncbi:hypothetical protein [Thalassotalea atypica]|nr:hypothetical protein [Thalassotalea atypica]